MLEIIITIGRFIRKIGKFKPLAELWIKKNKLMELSLVIDLLTNGNSYTY